MKNRVYPADVTKEPYDEVTDSTGFIETFKGGEHVHVKARRRFWYWPWTWFKKNIDFIGTITDVESKSIGIEHDTKNNKLL